MGDEAHLHMLTRKLWWEDWLQEKEKLVKREAIHQEKASEPWENFTTLREN
jgi:hypothetical protein